MCDDPVVIIESQTLYQTEGLIPTDNIDFCIPFGKGKIIRHGSDCTIVACGNMVPLSLEAASISGVNGEIIDPRTLDPLSMDWELITKSVEKTNRLLIVEQTSSGPSLGARIVQEAQDRLFDWLDHPIGRVSGSQSAPVVSKVLEDAALAGIDDVIEGINSLMQISGK